MMKLITYLRFSRPTLLLVSTYIFLYAISIPLLSITPGKWSYKDSYLLLPKEQKNFPKTESVFNSKGDLVLKSELKFQNGLLVEEKFIANGNVEGITQYIYDPSGRIAREKTQDNNARTTESKEFVYKGNALSKVRIFNETGSLYMDSNIYKWEGDLIQSGEITWSDTKDKEKILTEQKSNSRVMSILDEKKQPIATVVFIYDLNDRLVERLFTQGNTQRRNVLEYDSSGRLVQFTFHVKQEGKWVLEKTHKIGY